MLHLLSFTTPFNSYYFYHDRYRGRDITDEENPYDTVNIEEDDKIYEDLLSIKTIPVGELYFVCFSGHDYLLFWFLNIELILWFKSVVKMSKAKKTQTIFLIDTMTSVFFSFLF